MDDEGVMLGARKIPWPRSISAAAAAALRANATVPSLPMPPASDKEAWRQAITQVDRIMAEHYSAPEDPSIAVETENVAGVAAYRARPGTVGAEDRRLYIDIHGGGLVFGAGAFCRAGAVRQAALHRSEVLAVDYRMPPDHPYPAALDDCLAVYAHEVGQRGASNIVVGGGSAGGNLAAALMLRAREAGLPMPAGLVLLSPEVDLTESGDSFETLLGIDTVLKSRLTDSIALYADRHALDDPFLSPLFGDVQDFPRTLLQSGTRDLFLSNTVRMYRKLREANVAAELHVFEAMPHGGFFAGPEDGEMGREIARFVADCWNS
ncbi:hypothetical protein MB02_02335 [Croceicoccus estronivorus]|nr:hypothetical protein MB02_02335 [Croceicoccus estronivorus]